MVKNFDARGRLILVALSALAGCGISTYTTLLRQPPHAVAPRNPEAVEIFAAGPPTRPHVDLAFLEADEDTGTGAEGSGPIIAKLRARAGQLGCDALVLGAPFSRIDSFTTTLSGVATDRRGLAATCIVYTSAAEASGAAAPPSVGPLSAAPPALSFSDSNRR
jgi:hypothetical protein